jgi:phage tail-like protein
MSQITPRGADPIAGSTFGVEVDSVIEAFFSECSGISGQVKVETYEEGGDNLTTRKFPGRAEFANVTLKRGLSTDQALMRWFMAAAERNKALVPGKSAHLRKDITVIVFDREEKPMQRWTLLNAFPVKYSGSPMQTSANGAYIESIEFAHEGIAI